MSRNFDFKFVDKKAEDLTESDRENLATLYTQALESLYANDSKTKWYNNEGGEEKANELFSSNAADGEDPYYGNAAAILNGGWNEIRATETYVGAEGEASALSDEELVSKFTASSVMDIAKETYQRFLVEKLRADEQWENENLSEADESAVASTQAELEEAAAEAAAEAERATMEKLKASAASAGAAAASGGAGSTANIIEVKEQCFLLAFLHTILQKKSTTIDKTETKPIPYGGNKLGGDQNYSLMAGDEPFGFLNRLTQYGSQVDLLNMTTEEISSLQPKIQLYKVVRNAKGEEVNIPIKFDSHFKNVIRNHKGTAEKVLENKRKRGAGAGIKSFNFTYEGNNPFAVKKSITATLSIFANTFDELSQPRDVGDGSTYNYLDLALKTGGKGLRRSANKLDPKEEQRGNNLAKLDFRLKAIVGWQMPAGKTGISSSRTRSGLQNSFVTLNLTPVIHNFDFDDMGRVTFNIEYFAFVEDFYNQPVYTIFSDPLVMKNMLARKLKYDALSEECKSSEVAELRKNDKAQVVKDKAAALNWIVRTLTEKNKIRYISIDRSALSKIQSEGPWAAPKSVGWDINTIADETPQADQFKENAKEATSSSTGQTPPGSMASGFTTQISGSPDKYPVIFFFVSDLIDVIMEGIGLNLHAAHTTILPEIAKEGAKEGVPGSVIYSETLEGYKRLEENYRRLRVLLGPVEIVDPKNASNSKFVNLGDLPVSLKYFMEFLTEKTLKADQVFYPLPNFLNDFFNVYIRTFLNDDTCFNKMPGMKQRVRISQSTITDYKQLPGQTMDTISRKLFRQNQAKGALTAESDKYGPDCRKLNIRAAGGDGNPILNVAGFRDIDKVHRADAENDYLVYYAGRAQPVRVMDGNEKTDAKSGVFHYRIGKDRGIVKNIKLSRTEIPGLKEVRFEQGGYDGLEQLREVYNVDIDCFSNVSAYPGTYIFVNPLGFAPNMDYDTQATAQQGTQGDQFDLKNLTDYGIGGYFMIIRSSHTFGPGREDTTITARWVQEIEKTDDGLNTSPDVDEDTERPKKCTTGANSSREANADKSSAPLTEWNEDLGESEAPPVDEPADLEESEL